MSFRSGTVKDFSGFSGKDITPKTIDTIDIDTETLTVTEKAIITDLTTDTIDVGQLTVTGQIKTTSTTTIDLNGNISINNQQYVLSVKDFESALAQAAITGGLSIFVAPGTFFISKTLIVPKDTDIRGSGMNTTIFKALDGFSDTSMFTLGTNSSIADLQIDGNNTTGRLISLNNINNVNINQLKLTNSKSYMTIIENVCNNITITNCEYTSRNNSTGSVIAITTGSSDITLDNINFRTIGGVSLDYIIQIEDVDPTGAGLTTASIDNVIMLRLSLSSIICDTIFHIETTTNDITNISLNGIYIDTATLDNYSLGIINNGNQIQNINITDYRIINSSGSNIIYLNDVQNFILNVLKSTTNTFSLNIDINEAQIVTLSNIEINNTVDTTRDGIRLRSETSTYNTDINIQNCVISTGGIGILISSCKRINISNIVIKNIISSSGIHIGTESSTTITSQENIIINNCTFIATTGSNGIKFNDQDITTVIISNSKFDTALGIWIFRVDVDNMIIQSCEAVVSTLFIQFTVAAIFTNIQILNCIATSSTGDLSTGTIYLVDTADSAENIIIQGCKLVSPGSVANIRTNGITNFQVLNNQLITGSGGSGINASDCNTVIISNNRIDTTGTSGNNIDLSRSNKSYVNNNIINGGSQGINISSSSSGSTDIEYNVSNNFISDISTYGIVISSSGGTYTCFGFVNGNRCIISSTNNTPSAFSPLFLVSSTLNRVIHNDLEVNWAPTTTAGTSSYFSYCDRLLVDTTNTGGNLTLTLSDISIESVDHTIYIELDTYGGTNTLIVNPTSPGNDMTSLAVYTTGITFNASGEYAIFKWTGTTWDIIANSGGVIV